MSTLRHDPLDELRRVMLVALAYLFRIQGRGPRGGNDTDRDFRKSLEALESWARASKLAKHPAKAN